MHLKKRKESGIWHAYYVDREGKERSVSTREKDKRKAQRVADEAGLEAIELEARSGRIQSNVFDRAVLGQKSITVDRAITEWFHWLSGSVESEHTRSAYLDRVKKWAESLNIGHLPCSRLKPEHIDKWVNADDKGQVTNRRFILSCINSFTTWAGVKGCIVGNPAKLVRVKKSNLSHAQKEKKQVQLFEDHEVKALLSAVHPDEDNKYEDGFWFCAIILGRYAGLRIGDICKLHSESIAKPGYLTVWTQKRDVRVEIPLSNTYLQQAVLWLPHVSGEFWPVRSSESNDPKVRSKTSVQFKRLCESLDILGKSFHGLRHTFANECLKNGTTYQHIAELMGHMSQETTRKHYLQEAISKDGK